MNACQWVSTAFRIKKEIKKKIIPHPGVLSAGEQQQMLGKTAYEGSPLPQDILPAASNKQFKLFPNQHF